MVLPYTKADVIDDVILGLGRALDETMVVTFMIGDTNLLTDVSSLPPGNNITPALASEFAETGQGLHTAALVELGLVLLVITLVVLTAPKLLFLCLRGSEGQKRTNMICLTL